MNTLPAQGSSSQGNLGVIQYERHKPEQTILYQLIEYYYPQLLTHLASQGTQLPYHVQAEFEAYLKCGRLEHGFLRVRCDNCRHEKLVAFSCKKRGFCPSCGARRMAESAALLVDDVFPEKPVRQWVLSVPYPLRLVFAREPEILSKVLSIVNRAISGFLIKRAGQTRKNAYTGAVTLIQRFGSALNLNVHFHMLFLDGVYIKTKSTSKAKLIFKEVTTLKPEEIQRLTEIISSRVLRCLERGGIIERDAENSYLTGELFDEDSLLHLHGHSITYRIAVGLNKGRKVATLKTLPEQTQSENPKRLLGKVEGFSLHAGVAANKHQQKKLERLCRYITRPAVSTQRLSLTVHGNVQYELKTPFHDGTTHVIFEPLDFIARLAALVPKPRVNLTRFHGVFDLCLPEVSK